MPPKIILLPYLLVKKIFLSPSYVTALDVTTKTQPKQPTNHKSKRKLCNHTLRTLKTKTPVLMGGKQKTGATRGKTILLLASKHDARCLLSQLTKTTNNATVHQKIFQQVHETFALFCNYQLQKSVTVSFIFMGTR